MINKNAPEAIKISKDTYVEYPLKAIRQHCIDCANDKPGEVRYCCAVDCNLWPFRFGVNSKNSKTAKDLVFAVN